MKKLLNFKNIMFVICVGIAIISTFFSCEVRANTGEFINKNYSMDKNDIFNELENYFGFSHINASGKTYEQMKAEWYYASGSTFYFYRTGTGTNVRTNWVFWYGNGENPGIPTFSNLHFSPSWFYQIEYRSDLNQTSASFNWSQNGINNTIPFDSYYAIYIDENNNIWEYSNLDFSVVPNTFDFSPYGFQLSGDSATYWNKFSYVSGFIPLGLLGDNTYYQLDIKLRDSNGYDVANYSDVPGVGSISDENGRILNVENGLVSVNAIYLSYYSNYNLLFKVYDNSNDFETYIYAYQFMPFSAVIENGQIVSSGDTTFSAADSTILINENLNDWSQIGLILRQFGSGDFISSGDDDFNVSGDLFGLLGYSDYDNSYKDFVYIGIYQNLKDVFLSSNDREFTFNFMGSLITINSNEFITPNGVLKTFLSSFLVFGTIYYFYKTTIHFYHKMQEGNQLEAVQTWSVDDESILM